MRWDPQQYGRFSDHRSRPFGDLVARIPGDAATFVDLGCGDGALTATLLDRWPDATGVGVDSSAEMLARAPAGPRLRFEQGDIARWSGSADVILSNAALHWVADHEALLPRLLDCRVLAVQVPDNFAEPSHTLLREVARRRGLPEQPVHVRPLAWYAERLAAAGFAVDAWSTTYLHPMSGPDAVLQWVKGTALRPTLAAAGADAPALEAELLAAYREAYPSGPHGLFFPFRRSFFVGVR